MATTEPDDIYFTDGNTTESSENESAVQASSIQDAFDQRQIRTYHYATPEDQEGDQVGKRAGDMAYNEYTKANYRYNGTQWRFFGDTEWNAWTPSISGLSLGTGGYTSIFRFRHVGDSIQCKVKIAIGTGGSVSGNPSFTLPTPAAPPLANYQAFNGIGTIYIGSQIYPTVVVQISQTTGRFYAWNPTTSGYANVDANTPGVMGSAPTGFVIDFTYEPA